MEEICDTLKKAITCNGVSTKQIRVEKKNNPTKLQAQISHSSLMHGDDIMCHIHSKRSKVRIVQKILLVFQYFFSLAEIRKRNSTIWLEVVSVEIF